jgi:glycerol-3-phosphate dehydrogenase
MPRREEMWEKLGGEVDLLVVGGGINGAGIARDAALRGLSVAVVEMRDLAYGTSSRSSKLVHGGLRYLEHYEFNLVFEAVSERRILMDLAPHLVNPLGFLFPVFEGSKHKLWVINAGMWLYDGLSLFRSPKIHKKLKAKDVAALEPILKREGLIGAPLYYDCSTDDARLTLENAIDATQSGAVIATYVKLEDFVKDDQGRICGARVRNVLTGEQKKIAARAVINATGPWTDATLALSRGESKRLLRPTKGVHLVVAHDKLPVVNTVVCFHPNDDRVLFAVPWGDRTYVGTTDTDFDLSSDITDIAATGDDIDYLLDAANAYFPNHRIGRDDVISTWAGLRPLIAPEPTEEEVAESAVSREHQILVGKDGLITVAGGKLTTYRRMAAEVVDTAVRLLTLMGAVDRKSVKPCATEFTPLPGGVDWPDDDDHDAVAAEVVAASGKSLPTDVARHLADTYGGRAKELGALVAASPALGERLIDGRPEIVAQIDWGVNEELAAEVTDVMIRRTQLFYRDPDQGLGAIETVGRRMQELLGWDDARRESSLETYREAVARSRRWRTR